MSPYVAALREKIGTTVLEVPSVSILVFDDADRVLLVRHVGGTYWTTPGGMVEPYETPANAAVREVWEETGLFVNLTHIIGVFGGPTCGGTYANGDQVAWVSTLFRARRISGRPRPDGEETEEVRYFGRSEIDAVKCRPYVDSFLNAAYRREQAAYFVSADWHPPGA
jgi:8-oxo-dGTP pyrophosphatase MutT (NUDIX family)